MFRIVQEGGDLILQVQPLFLEGLKGLVGGRSDFGFDAVESRG